MISALIFFSFLAYVFYLIFGRSKANTVTADGVAQAAIDQKRKVLRTLEVPAFFVIYLVMVVVAYNIFFHETWEASRLFPTVGLAGLNAAWLVALFASFPARKRTPLVWVLTAVGFTSGLFMIYRSSGFVQGLNLLVMGMSSVMLVFLRAFDTIYWRGLWLFKHFLGLIPQSFGQFFGIFRYSKESTTGNKKSFALTFIKTAVITLIVVVFFISLLSSADPVFDTLIQEFRDQAVARTIASIIVAVCVSVLLTMHLKADEENRWSLKFFSFQDLFIPALAVATLFAAFLVVQVKYLFGSHVDLQTFDLTYSEYVRKGFVELLVATFFGGLLSYILILKHRVIGKLARARELQVVTIVLILELGMLLVSALKRDLMYVDVYGLTRVRIVGGLFLFWLAGDLLLLMALNVSKALKERHLFMGLGVLSLAVWLGLNGLNVDQMVVNGTPEHHDYTDYFYISNLSEDGITGWELSATEMTEVVDTLTSKNELTDIEKSHLAGTKLALITLQEKRSKLLKKYADYNWVVENYDILRTNNDLINRTGHLWENEYSTSSIAEKKEKKQEAIEDALKQYRGDWRHYNLAEHKVAQIVYANQDLYFDQVDTLLRRIREYQVMHQLSLYDQEYRLLREFKYPFITIKLEYHPENLSNYRSPRRSNGEFTVEQMSYIQRGRLISQVNQARCSQDLGEIEAYGMVIDPQNQPVINSGEFMFWLWNERSSSDTGYLPIITRDAFSAQKLRQTIQNDAVFVKVKLRHTADGANTCGTFEILEWQEIKQLD